MGAHPSSSFQVGIYRIFDLVRSTIDGLVKSQKSDDKVKSFRCKACKYEGMRRTYVYAAMTEDAAQRSRWTFYEVVTIGSSLLTEFIAKTLTFSRRTEQDEYGRAIVQFLLLL